MCEEGSADVGGPGQWFNVVQAFGFGVSDLGLRFRI